MEIFFGTTLRAEYQKSEILIGGNLKFFKLLVSPSKQNKNWKIINGDVLKLLGFFSPNFLLKLNYLVFLLTKNNKTSKNEKF